MEYLALFLLGLSVGSFLNVVIYRLHHGGSALKGRSYCDHCRKKISWHDNIPLLSYLWLKGRCRYCKKKIPVEYPLTELLVGIEFAWLYWLLKVNFEFFGRVEGFYSLALLIYWLILFSGSLVIVIYDLKFMVIPDVILWPLIGVVFLRLFFSQQWSVLPVAIGSVAWMFGLWLVTKKRGLGFGDVKLGLLLGLVLGWPRILVAYFLAFLTGAGVGVILVATGKRKLKSKIAFGPFLLLGMTIAKLWGESIWQWYLSKVLLY